MERNEVGHASRTVVVFERLESGVTLQLRTFTHKYLVARIDQPEKHGDGVSTNEPSHQRNRE